MSNRLRVLQSSQTGKLAFALVASAFLAGCSGLGIGSSSDSGPLITGSSQSQPISQLNQSLPGALPSASGAGPYTPPNAVGQSMPSNSIVTGSIAPGQQSVAGASPSQTSITTQALPALPQPTSTGSTPTMQANQTVTPLFQDSEAPLATPPAAKPNLRVVPDNAFQHTIERGESLYVIARRYDVTTDAIVHANSLISPDQIYVGQQLIIPGRADLLAAKKKEADAKKTEVDEVTTASINAAPVPATKPESVAAPKVEETKPVDETRTAAVKSETALKDFRWPIQGRVIVDFASSRQTGINIEAPEGASVRAAENGKVIYVGNGIEGYGNLVLVRHDNGFVSAYAHLKDVTVAKDNVVRRGDTIGTVGMSGSVKRPQLHFELRQGATPVDPMPLLAG